MSSVTPYQGHTPRAEPGTAPTQRTPATIMNASQDLRDSAGRTLQATVAGRDAQGHLLLRSEGGTLAIATQLDPPRGSLVTLQLRLAGSRLQAYILRVTDPGGSPIAPSRDTKHPPRSAPWSAAPKAPPDSGLGARPAGSADPVALTRSWPALEAALAALGKQRSGPLLDALPRPGPGFATGLLFALIALNGGDLRMLLGNETRERIASAGGHELLQRLERDFADLGRLAREERTEWRLFVLPVVAEDGPRPLRLFVRDGGEGAASPESPQRFIAETDLPRLGELQLDGLLQVTQFDLILRSRTALGDALQGTLRAIFAETKALAGIPGQLYFAADVNWQFMPIPNGHVNYGVKV